MNSGVELLNRIKKLLPALLMLLTVTLSGQEPVTTCAENLKNAQDLFSRGQISGIPGMLEECMRSGFTREEYLDAYKLLIQVFLFEDKLDKADSTMLEFLGKYPEYELSPTDHSSFTNLYNSFNVRPLLQISLKLGTSFPFTSFKTIGSVTGIEGASSYKASTVNFYAAIEARIKLSEKMDICIEPGFSQFELSNIKDVNNYFGIPFTSSTYIESRSRIELPLSVTYNIVKLNKLTPYVRLGGGAAINISNTATAETESLDDNNNDDHSGSSLDRSESRKAFDAYIQTGAGIKYKIRGGYIMGEVRLNTGLINQVVRGGSTDPEMNIFYYYTDDDYRINALNFTIGYTKIFYKPGKK